MNATKTIDYATFKDSYCHYLEPKMKQLCYLAHAENISAEQMRSKIYDIVKNAAPTAKFDKFLETIVDMDDKLKMYLYIRNSVNKAKQTMVEAR